MYGPEGAMTPFAALASAMALMAALLAPSAQAQVPLQVQYQGYLTDGAGARVNAPTGITFRLGSWSASRAR
jgi:type 1 fimbria pilin